MPAISALIEYLADSPLYRNEKPWSGLLIDGKKLFERGQKLDNIELVLEEHTVEDVVEYPELSFQKQGFVFWKHESKTLSEFDTMPKVLLHREEISEFLTEKLDAVFVKTYDCHTRTNTEKLATAVDVFDELEPDSPARGAHNDITMKSGPEVVERNFTAEEKEKYLRPGYRFRIINTWRPLLPVCEDRPLAVCDASSIKPGDLIAADRVYPHTIGEIYYLKPNKNHRWFWMENQTPSDVLIMTMYDTKPGNDARYCPHISFENSRAASDAPKRHSVETRSIVVTKI